MTSGDKRVEGQDGVEILVDRLVNQFWRRFDTSPKYWGVAPGRIEFVGNHTDYNGGQVLGLGVNLGVAAVMAPRSDGKLAFHTNNFSEVVELEVGHNKRLEGRRSWVNYPLGVWRILVERFGLESRGWSLALNSNLPRGSGLSSSAALELAVASALRACFELEISPLELARIGRRAENEFVGVPCGILDQGVSAHAERDHLVGIDCDTETFDTVPLPEGSRFWTFQSGVKHRLSDSLYSVRFEECRQAAGLLESENPAKAKLAHWKPGEWESYAKAWPENLRRRARHVISENQRVSEVRECLARGDSAGAGERLFASHASSRDDFENSIPELDFLVEACRGIGGVQGARLTGGGFGGAVVAWLTGEPQYRDVDRVQEAFRERFGKIPAWQELTSHGGATGGKF